MPQRKFNELYQDQVRSCILRAARELFSILPVKFLIVNAIKNMLNTKTGYKEDQPIISVVIPRETLEQLNFNAIDPSDSMDNFVHNIAFKKSKGFNAVQRVKSTDLQ